MRFIAEFSEQDSAKLGLEKSFPNLIPRDLVWKRLFRTTSAQIWSGKEFFGPDLCEWRLEKTFPPRIHVDLVRTRVVRGYFSRVHFIQTRKSVRVRKRRRKTLTSRAVRSERE